MSFSGLFGQMLFGTVGFFAFIYGKKQGLWKVMVVGILLMILPYLISDNWFLYISGSVLTVLLFIWRD